MEIARSAEIPRSVVPADTVSSRRRLLREATLAGAALAGPHAAAGAAPIDAAIDRALAERLASHGTDAEPFFAIAARLRRARRPHDLVNAARGLHALERMLTR